ncbi:hypothetical protein JN06_00970 [Bacteroides zoogleoformans]|nr:hypothetical protein JN06_00970 [Bacteroides zoogleoformans]
MRKKCYYTVNYFRKNLFGNYKSAYFALCLKQAKKKTIKIR